MTEPTGNGSPPGLATAELDAIAVRYRMSSYFR